MEKETLKLNLYDKVVIEDRYTGQYEEEILKLFEYKKNTYCYKTENFELNIHSAGRISIYKNGYDKDQNIDYNFKIVEAKRSVNIIENGIYKTIDMTFWKNGKYLELDEVEKRYGRITLVNKEDIYKRKYEDLVFFLSCANKQITLNTTNNVQTLVLDLSCLHPDIKQDLYKLIVKEE